MWNRYGKSRWKRKRASFSKIQLQETLTQECEVEMINHVIENSGTIENEFETIPKNPDWITSELNTEQIDAVTSTEGYIRVIAGAGTGKTKALTYRYSYLVKEVGILPRNILCVTFTNKAANEMKSRIRTLTGDNDLGFICTFHSACVQILRDDIYPLNYPKNFIVLDSDDVETILRSVYEDTGLKSKDYPFNLAKNMIKKRKYSIDYISLLIDDNWSSLKEKSKSSDKHEDIVFYGYLYEQRKCYGLDFDDLILFTVHIFETNQDILDKWQRRFTYVMVDEFQDVNVTQYTLTKYLSGLYKNLFIVGDPDQTIYSWRGAHVEFILNFDKAFSNVKTITLKQNYRSTHNILDVSNSLITKNKMRIEKVLFTNDVKDIPVIYYHAVSTKAESDWIAQTIKDYINQGVQLNNICILYRAHYVSRSIEEALIDKDISYRIYSGIEFYQRKEIKDMLAYLRFVIHLDDLSFVRIINVPKRGFGNKRAAYIKEFADKRNCSFYEALKENSEHDYFASDKFQKFIELIDYYHDNYSKMKISDLLNELFVKSGYEDLLTDIGEQERLVNIAELKQSIFDYETYSNEESLLEDYLTHIALFTNMDKRDSSNAINLMTVHSAKGLEFPIVFVCGLNEGIFPSKRIDTMEKLEEERRLAYVAFTRAQERLFLSESEGFNYDNSFRHPSRFIFNIDEKLLDYIVKLPESIKSSAIQCIDDNEKYINLVLFCVGDRIKHPLFGDGEIRSIVKNLGYIIVFDKLPIARTISFTAKLEKI